jgi:NAD(P)-dependent dehydrogenase (short-subunit alcohol dehydrogenase family)
MKDISGKTAIVTGAASGIGLGIATALAKAGANVVMADIQKDAVEQAAHGLSGTKGVPELPPRLQRAAACRPACRCTARGFSMCHPPTGSS